MGLAIRAAKLSCELALQAKDRNPHDRWLRERYEHALMALERLEAAEIEQTQNRRVAANHTAA